MEFLDERYKGVKDGIEFGEGVNPKITKKMKFFQTQDEGVFLRIRFNKVVRLADTDKIKCRVVIADEIPGAIKVKVVIKNKPARILKICKVGQINLLETINAYSSVTPTNGDHENSF